MTDFVFVRSLVREGCAGAGQTDAGGLDTQEMRDMSSPNLRFERRGEGPPLLLMHGLGSSLRVWDPVRPLLEAHMDIIALDLPGHGGSPPPSPQASSPGALALTIAALLDRLGIQTAHLAGNSFGGWLALELAKIGRARSVTALSPAGLWRKRAPTYHAITFYAYRAIARRLKSKLPYLAGNPITRTILLWQFFGRPWALPPAAAIEAASSFVDAAGFDAIFAAASRERFRGGGAIDVPVSIAWGGRDVFLLPWQSRCRDELPSRVRWTILRGCGHVPTFDDPQAVATVILETTSGQSS
jgi:pimeloyl-ACP methyl ester carboxylesterase